MSGNTKNGRTISRTWYRIFCRIAKHFTIRADPGTADLGSTEAHGDPSFHVSYSYERTADISNGLAQPLGRFPKPDIAGTAWGSWRFVNNRMEAFFGDQVPLVRCYHHRPPEDEREPGTDLVLNLTPAGRVYKSDFDWREHPDSIGFLLRTLERDFMHGPAWVLRNWNLWRVDEFFGAGKRLDRPNHAPWIAGLAERLVGQHRELVGEERTACRLAARLFAALGDSARSLQALDAAAMFPGAEWQPIIEDQMRAEVYHAAARWDDEIATYERLLAQRPDVMPYMASLADAYDAAGKPEQARPGAIEPTPAGSCSVSPRPRSKLSSSMGRDCPWARLSRDTKRSCSTSGSAPAALAASRFLISRSCTPASSLRA